MAPLCPNRANMASGSPLFKGQLVEMSFLMAIVENGTGSRARTYDLRFWRPPLYQLSYARIVCASAQQQGLPKSFRAVCKERFAGKRAFIPFARNRDS